MPVNWAEGQPEELTQQFLALIGGNRSSLGADTFLAYVKVCQSVVLAMRC
jgi:hypothetical protein